MIDRSQDDLKALIRRDHPLDTRIIGNQSPLHLAVGWTRGLNILLSAGADPGVADKRGHLALQYAFEKKCYQSAMLLLSFNSPFTKVCTKPCSKCFREDMELFGDLRFCSARYQDDVIDQLFQRRRLLLKELNDRLMSA